MLLKANGGQRASPMKRTMKIRKIPRAASSRRRIEGTVKGLLTVVKSGNGFVKPDNSPDAEDIMIPYSRLGTAMDGDIVEVEVSSKRTGKTEGRVVSVAARSGRSIVCTMRRAGRFLAAVPISSNFKNSFFVEDTHGALEGDRVIVRFVSWKNPAFNPEGEITAVIGPEDDPSTDTISVIKQYGLPEVFPKEVETEAESIPFPVSDEDGRIDLRDKVIFTVDPGSARDFDDALSVWKDKSGRTVLGVHIADVSHFVRPGTNLDREAMRRGTSVYLVDKVIPMLPEQLSNGVCSLSPDEDRLAFSVFITFDSDGNPLGRSFSKTLIRSKKRLTYEQAQEIIDLPDGTYGPVETAVRDVFSLTEKLRSKRLDAFSLDLSSPEIEILMDGHLMTGVRPVPHYRSNEMIEEAMVAANEAVATELSSRGIKYISRFHDAPDHDRLDELSTGLAILGISGSRISGREDICRVLKSVQGTALEQYVSMLVLKSMKRAEYSAVEHGHFGLAKKYYAHFTSPIRRYPDLVTHRQLHALLTGGEQPSSGELSAAALISTDTEYRAEQASRELIEIKKYRFLEQCLRNGTYLDYKAIVVKVVEFGVFVEIPDLQIGGMIHVSALSDKFLRYDPARSSLYASGVSFAPGDKLDVILNAVKVDERKVDFVLPMTDGGSSGSGTGHGFSATSSEYSEKGRKRISGTGKSDRRGRMHGVRRRRGRR